MLLLLFVQFLKKSKNKNGAVQLSLTLLFAGFLVASKHVKAAFLRSDYLLWEFTLQIEPSPPDLHFCFDIKTLSEITHSRWLMQHLGIKTEKKKNNS